MAVFPLPAEAAVGTSADALIAAALADLDEDLGMLVFVCAAAQGRLSGFADELSAACPCRETHALLARTLTSARRRYRALMAHLGALREQAQCAPPSRALVAHIAAQRSSLADRVRVEQSLLAGLIAAPDWQSPTFAHSVAPAAGRLTGRIRAHWDDYRRDRHRDAEVYERRYLQAMLDGATGAQRALLTGCGMAAFTTILWWLLAEGKLAGPVLAGRGIYHETRLLLERMLTGRLRFVDETDTAALLHAIDELRPSAVFLDSLSNTRCMPVPDLRAVIERLRGTDTYLIIDNTCLSVSCQPFALADGAVRLVMFESLLKYAQLGLDRTNAGLIVAPARDAEVLDTYREHLGTNIADVAVHALPPPDRAVLMRRMARLERNAIHLAERLGERAPPGVDIVYPGAGAHPGIAAGTRLPFRGGCVSVAFAARTVTRGRRLVLEAVAEAARRDVRLHAGASFGFDTTRIYLTAARATGGTPFVRLAAGTEHRLELEALSDALAAALGTCA